MVLICFPFPLTLTLSRQGRGDIVAMTLFLRGSKDNVTTMHCFEKTID